MDRKLTKRQLQAIEAKEKIRNSAIALFAEYGFDKVTIEMICQNAGVSTGLLYNYFPSKEAILVENFQTIDQTYQKIAAGFLPGQTARERLILVYEGIFKHTYYGKAIDAQACKVAYTNAIKTGESPLNDQNRFFFHLLTEIVRYGRERGELKVDLPDADMVHLLYLLSTGTVFTSFIAKDVDAHIQQSLKVIDNALAGLMK